MQIRLNNSQVNFETIAAFLADDVSDDAFNIVNKYFRREDNFDLRASSFSLRSLRKDLFILENIGQVPAFNQNPR